ncbi:hypothetical protein CARUB_v10007745mg [Capsella rubella]|uniref:Protease Do-like PDZ domain-containing protein n=1 Tax=Capsella rubella TaxID=81985 RepID=R0GQC4_9BRAS|nr:hypothetical protein CARUB_v10007745mg [Capsella rubella]
MSFWWVRGRTNLVRSMRTNRIFTGVLRDFASLFSTSTVLPSSVNAADEKTINSVVTTTESSSVLDSVVMIHTCSSKPNICYPWQNMPQRKSSGSGFVVPGRKIITNAHVVADHILVLVIKHGSRKKYKAEVKAMGRECDLAILEIESEEFWEDMNPLELGDMPFMTESVVVVGYPIGGESISTTKGVVSRIGSKNYAQGGATSLPVIQTDAAMNHGNSGGPVCIGNKVVGVAFQGLRDANSIGDYDCNYQNFNGQLFMGLITKFRHVIPAKVVKHFITSVEKTGHCVGFCSLHLSYQHMLDANTRNHFKMDPDMTGVLIYNIYEHSDALNVLRKEDIILEIDGVPIGNDGIVVLPNKEENVTLGALVSMKQSGETILVKVLREAKTLEFSITLTKLVQGLVPAVGFDNNNPSYYIFAGFVFVPYSYSKKHIKGSNGMLKHAYHNMPKKAGQQNVMISEILVDMINVEHYMYKNSQTCSSTRV